MNGPAPPSHVDPGRDRLALAVIGVVSLLVAGLVAALMLGGRSPAGVPRLVALLPTVNATLNGLSAVLLTVGYLFIRRRRVRAHLTCMLLAFGVSTLFLVSYVTYHALAGSRPFGGQGWIRWVYFPLLLSHVVLAAAILPLALTTLYRALRGDFVRHAGIARWTLPLWLYVSVTGVLVYWLLYHF